MTEKYTPTTEEVRAEFVTNKAIRKPTTWRGADEFDRWLAEHDRQVAERARIGFADELTRKGGYTFDIHSIRKYARGETA